MPELVTPDYVAPPANPQPHPHLDDDDYEDDPDDDDDYDDEDHTLIWMMIAMRTSSLCKRDRW